MENMMMFGEKLVGIEYHPRPGVYAVIYDGDANVAVVKTSTGYFLPGGGLEADETHEICLKRECLEELGFDIRVNAFIGRALKYFYSTTRNEYMVSDGFFYAADIVCDLQTPTEEDHELVWIPRNNIADVLFHEHQVWAVERAFEDQ